MQVNPKIISFFPKYVLKHSDSGKKIIKYDESRFSDDLFSFLNSHPAIRVSFNSMIKANFTSVEMAFKNLLYLLKESKTSLIYETKCKTLKCEKILEKPHIYDLKKIKFPKTITCPSCKKPNYLELKDYNPNYEIDFRDFIKLFYLEENSVFNIYPFKECFNCGKSETNISDTIHLNCKYCSEKTHISMQIFHNKDLETITKDFWENRQGYWLEWYVWNLLKNKYITDVGISINKYEADIILIYKNKKIFIECKDTSDSALKHITKIKKDFDYYILVSTQKYKESYIYDVQAAFKKKFIQIAGHEIENMDEIIEKKIK